LLPFFVFNQQVVTGRSMQPFHYEILIANYVVLLSLVLLNRLLQPVISRRATLLIVASCLIWGTIEVSVGVAARHTLNTKNDEMVPVLLRLRERANNDGTWEGLRNHGKAPTLVFSPELRLSGLLPTWAPQPSLLPTGSESFQTLSEAGRRGRLYLHLYYCNRNKEYLRDLLNDRVGDRFATYYMRSSLFGAERGVTFLSQTFEPIQQEEIEHVVNEYESFVASFSRIEASMLPISYVVTRSDESFDFSKIDLWYERDAGEQIGIYSLIHLTHR
jgi:hypothetical protein